MSIEEFLGSKEKNQRPTFKKVAGRLLSEKEPPEDTRPWKWEEEITESDWDRFTREMDGRKEKESWLGFVHFAGLIYLLDPTHTPSIPDVAYQAVEKHIEELYKKNETMISCLTYISDLHLLNPTHNITINSLRWNDIKEKLKNHEEKNNLYSFLMIATLIKRIDYTYSIPDVTALSSELSRKFKTTNSFKNFSTIQLAAQARILGLTSFNHLPIEAWEHMKTVLKNMQKTGLSTDVAQLFYFMRILAAHKAEITKDGIIITDKPTEQLDVSLPPRPIRKKH